MTPHISHTEWWCLYELQVITRHLTMNIWYRNDKNMSTINENITLMDSTIIIILHCNVGFTQKVVCTFKLDTVIHMVSKGQMR